MWRRGMRKFRFGSVGSQVYCALGDHSSLVHNPRAFPHMSELKIMMLMMSCVVLRVSLTLREPC